jgi:hypothetical protein
MLITLHDVSALFLLELLRCVSEGSVTQWVWSIDVRNKKLAQNFYSETF